MSEFSLFFTQSLIGMVCCIPDVDEKQEDTNGCDQQHGYVDECPLRCRVKIRLNRVVSQNSRL